MKNIIEIKNLTKKFTDGTQALSSVNLDIQNGEIIALLGPNGAGKTTLISAVCGITNISSGSVTVGGFDVKKDYRKTRSMIGLVPQEIALQPFEKVIDVVRYSRNLFGCKNDDKYIEDILKRLLLWEKKDKRIVELSGGMKRRVIIAKALSHEPKILFLDEPTAGVDVDLRIDMWELIKEIRRKGTTIILTTHYIEEAEEIADRISIISKGQILLTEKKTDLIEKMGQKVISIELNEPINDKKYFDEFDISVDPDSNQKIINYNFLKSDNNFDIIRQSAEKLNKWA
ncbi:MAG: ABC transporter ATP-binding protein, partial [Alphaproteobacteria bacterium]|nr:ABC transporter ATP-binding protein [Alphaproteobacteria bacterium]